MVLVFFASLEFSNLFLPEKEGSKIFLILCALLFPAGVVLAGARGLFLALLPLSLFALLVYMFKSGDKREGVVVFVGAFYIGFFFSHFLLLYNLKEFGRHLVLLVFVSTWVYDISAYFAGKSFGKRKLAPSISPNKTWEGAISATFITLIFLSLLFFFPYLNLFERLLFSLGLSIFAPLGDLVESKLKRIKKVKDTGSIVPGHGGILDRFDSLLFTVTFSYYFFKLIL